MEKGGECQVAKGVARGGKGVVVQRKMKRGAGHVQFVVQEAVFGMIDHWALHSHKQAGWGAAYLIAFRSLAKLHNARAWHGGSKRFGHHASCLGALHDTERLCMNASVSQAAACQMQRGVALNMMSSAVRQGTVPLLWLTLGHPVCEPATMKRRSYLSAVRALRGAQ